MNVGEKISLFKERLGFRNFQEFGKAVGVSGDWINELSKKTEIKITDVSNLYMLCKSLDISIEQLIKNDEEKQLVETVDVKNINITTECNDINVVINEVVNLLEKEDITIEGKLLNNHAKQIFRDSLKVAIMLAKQNL